MRFLRLAIGLWAIIEALQNKTPLLGLLGAALIIMAVLNIGCCGANNCTTHISQNKKLSQKPGEIHYEEIT